MRKLDRYINDWFDIMNFWMCLEWTKNYTSPKMQIFFQMTTNKQNFVFRHVPFNETNFESISDDMEWYWNWRVRVTTSFLYTSLCSSVSFCLWFKTGQKPAKLSWLKFFFSKPAEIFIYSLKLYYFSSRFYKIWELSSWIWLMPIKKKKRYLFEMQKSIQFELSMWLTCTHLPNLFSDKCR